MKKQKHFCTCEDLECKLNPSNHDLGCDPCIKKNIREGEIPGCFFRLVDGDMSNLKEYSLQSFVDFYTESKKG